MKKSVALVCLAISFSFCVTAQKVINGIETHYEIDFSPFTQKGFLFTPQNYLGEYSSIGMINYFIVPGAKYEKGGAKKYYSSTTKPTTISTYEWKSDTVDFRNVLEKIHSICESMGADALVDFKIEPVPYTHTNILEKPFGVMGYSISGYAIKRK